MNYYCCSEQRRIALKEHPFLNGIDFVEVIDNKNDAYEDRQTTLIVHFINPLQQGSLQSHNIIIEGGERITNIKVISVNFGLTSPPFSPLAGPAYDDFERILFVRLNVAGDYSTYTLRLVIDGQHKDAPPGYDLLLSSVDFSFKVLCDNDFDCKTQCECVTKIGNEPDINYLAKDYAGFRQLMLDRMALLTPQWKERNPADSGIMLIELLAYVADYLSYRQDAISTEAYLGTARKRSSVRRHARLVDYYVHDGSNARTWLHIKVSDNTQNLHLKRKFNDEITKVLTKRTGYPAVSRPNEKPFETLINKVRDPAATPLNKTFEFVLPPDLQIFELLEDAILDERHNEMNFYTWLDKECCLPERATSAVLEGHFPALEAGQVLIFAEIAGPITGKSSDANPLNRHAVKLTRVVAATDPLTQPAPTPITKIYWDEMDALPFPFCISSTDANGKAIKVTTVYGNNVLIDHGFTIAEELPVVPAINDARQVGLTIREPSGCMCEGTKTSIVPLRYRPFLKQRPITQAVPYDSRKPPSSAATSLSCSARELCPAIRLIEAGSVVEWYPKRDLLESKHNDEQFVVELENDGTSYLVFGNNTEGKRPGPSTKFTAFYRVGNGVRGNVGTESLTHLVSADPSINTKNIEKVWNPLPATGGTEPENMNTVRMRAPIAFRRQERAVTLGDYEEISKGVLSEIQRTAASLRWTGSWRTVFISVDKFDGKKIDNDFKNKLRSKVEKYRMAGEDLEVTLPQFVNLEIEMSVCVKPNYFKSDVKKRLLEIFSNKQLPNGSRGVFHPDNFSFGKPVYLSPIYSAAQQAEGVQSVKILVFQRQGIRDEKAIPNGKLLLNRFEIARLDNNPNFPERGVFKLNMLGGK